MERGKRRWFPVALLLALASALVPALVHSGLPATRLIGSAFDPATSSVALRGRAHMPVRTEASADRKPDAALPPFAAPAQALPAYPAAEQRDAARGLAPAWSRPAPNPHDALRRLTDARPRAPPLRAL